jgi:predicted enzyme related to lactoylglutathione lyase
MSNSHGRFVWYELMTSDQSAAEAFYKEVIGWGARDAGVPGMSYSLMTVEENPVAGVMTVPEEAKKQGARPGWIGYVAVDDVDKRAAELTEIGGTVYRAPDDIPGVGRFAIVADPQGAVIALFKGSSEEPPAPPRGTPGQAGWHELYTTDVEPAFAFYARLFGWTKADALDMGPMGVYQLFAHNEVPIGGMMRRPPSVPAPFWTYYFNVAGIDAAVERIKAAGGQIINGPMEVPGGSRIVQCLDPQGAMFCLVEPAKN